MAFFLSFSHTAYLTVHLVLFLLPFLLDIHGIVNCQLSSSLGFGEKALKKKKELIN